MTEPESSDPTPRPEAEAPETDRREAAEAEVMAEDDGFDADGFDDDFFEDDDGASTARKRWRPRALHWHVGGWTLVAIGLMVLFLFLSSMSVTGRVIVLPNWVAEKVLARMNAALPEGRLSLRQVEFGVTPKGRPRLRLVDVGITDATGLELARLNGVESGFRIGPALRGKLEPTVVRLTGAQITLRRLSDGTFALSFGQQASTSGTLGSVLDSVDAVFTDGMLKGSELVEASDLTITLEDARSGRLWQVTDGRMRFIQTDTYVDTEVSFDVFNQTEELAHTLFNFRTDKATSEASLSARFDNAAARDIAAQTPALAFLSVIDAPISGALRTTVDEEGAISGLAGTLSAGRGALSPTPGAPPAAFDGARVYLDYDPTNQSVHLMGVNVSSEVGTVEGEGQFFLTDFAGGLPNRLIGQVTLSNGRLVAADMFEAPLTIDHGNADFRIQLSPFSVEIGQAVMFRGERRYSTSGRIGAGNDGWTIALDTTATGADRDEVLALWPLNTAPTLRSWFSRRIDRLQVDEAHIAFRQAPGQKLAMTGVYNLRDSRITALEALPPIELSRGYLTQGESSVTLAVEEGTMTAPDGSVLDVSGSAYSQPSVRSAEQIGKVDLAAAGSLTGMLELLNLPPFEILAKTSYGTDVARGDIRVAGKIAFPLEQEAVTIADMDIALTGRLTGVRSDVLIKDRLLLADALDLALSETGLDLTGPVQIGRASASGTWHLPMGASAAAGEKTSITGTVELSDRTLGEFDIALPDAMLTGAGPANFTVTFPDGTMQLDLVSDLRGVGLSIPGTGWTKAPSSSGKLTLTATLGARPVVSALSLTAPGLKATGGRITTAEGGQLGEARFERVKLGDWFDGGVTITGRGSAPVAIAITSGTLDMRKADLADGGGGSAARGPKQPLSLNLSRLIISEGIRIRDLKGDFDLSGGLTGTFTGTVVGGAPIQGTVAPSGGRSAFRITSNNAGAVLRGAGVFSTARGGKLELILAPVDAAGTYEGDFTITGTQVVNSPSMLKLLSAVSVVGLIDQLNGEGISFTEVEGRFRLSPDSVTLYRSSAVGISLGISLDGYYDLKNGIIDMQGVLSPFYIVNVLGRIFSPRDGEGLIGFNFNIKGPYDGPEVQVNPLSILTPGAFREIFRRPPPEAPAE